MHLEEHDALKADQQTRRIATLTRPAKRPKKAPACTIVMHCLHEHEAILNQTIMTGEAILDQTIMLMAWHEII